MTLQYTDWGVLASHKVVIAVRASAEGAQLANDVYRELEKAGIKQIGFALPEAQLLAQNTRHKWIAKVHDISRVILSQAPLRDTFLAFAEREFGLKLDPEKEQALSLGDFLALSTSEVTWLIPDLLRVGDRVMLYGMAKSGKTTWLVHEALHMAANGHSVLYVDGEMSVADFQTRLNSGLAGAQLPEQFQILSSCALRRGLHLQDPETQAFVLQQTKKAEIVILDNLHALFPSSLQAGPESCEGLNNMVNTLHRSGKTVIVVHHTSRSGASFGSSVKELGLELLLKVTRTGRDITIKPEAARGLSLEQMAHRHFSIPSAVTGLNEGFPVKELPPASEKKEASNVTVSLENEDKTDQAIRREMDANPHASCRAIAQKIGVGKSTVHSRKRKIEEQNE